MRDFASQTGLDPSIAEQMTSPGDPMDTTPDDDLFELRLKDDDADMDESTNGAGIALDPDSGDEADDSLDAGRDGEDDDEDGMAKAGSDELQGELLTRKTIAQWKKKLQVSTTTGTVSPPCFAMLINHRASKSGLPRFREVCSVRIPRALFVNSRLLPLKISLMTITHLHLSKISIF